MNFAFNFISYIFKFEFDNHLSGSEELKLFNNENYTHDFSDTSFF
jgi:hypothetical protein